MRVLYPKMTGSQWPEAINALFREIIRLVRDKKQLRIGNFGEFYESVAPLRKVKVNVGADIGGEAKTPVMARLRWRSFRFVKEGCVERRQAEDANRAVNDSSAQGCGIVE